MQHFRFAQGDMGPKDCAIAACGPDDLVIAMTYADSMRQFYYVVPRSKVVAWYLAQPAKRHHELVRGPCKLALDLDGAGFTAAQRDACVARLTALVGEEPVHLTADIPHKKVSSHVVFRGKLFARFVDQRAYVESVLMPRLPPELRGLVDTGIYTTDRTFRLWGSTKPGQANPFVDRNGLRSAEASLVGSMLTVFHPTLSPRPTSFVAAPVAVVAVPRAGPVGGEARSESERIARIAAYLRTDVGCTIVHQTRRRGVGVGSGTVVFFALAQHSCPHKGRPHKRNHVYFHFFPGTRFGYYQCSDTQDCGPRRRWGCRCYCLESTGTRCPRCTFKRKYWAPRTKRFAARHYKRRRRTGTPAAR